MSRSASQSGRGGTKSQTRRARVEEKEQAIIDAAHKVFSENSFDKAKMAEIARLSGVAEGTVYLYFENKDALRLAVLGRFYERLTEEAAAGVAKLEDTVERLRFLARHHVDSCSRDWSLLMMSSLDLRINDRYHDSDAHHFNRTYVAVFDQVIRASIDRGDLRPGAPMHVVRDLFYGGLEYLNRTLRLRRDSGKVDVEREVADFVDALGTGILSVGKATPQAEASGFGDLMRRLETVASRMEATAEN